MGRSGRINSFKLLWKAIKESRQSMWVSMQVLIVITFVLATVFFFAEYKVQGEDYNYGKSLVWAFTRYIDDPGEFSHVAPVTTTGRWMATLIGIVGILIFAVPAGLIGGAFTKAIEDEQRSHHLEEIGDRLNKAFRRKQEYQTRYCVVPRYISLGTLQATKEMTEKDIIDAVKHNPPYRLRNLATAEIKGARINDQLVVEMFPLNNKYGCCIDRGSDITIVCPTGLTEAAVSNFAFNLALIGGFNYISKELDTNLDEPTSYYLIKDENKNPEIRAYVSDLHGLSQGKNKWTIFIISSETRQETEMHFVTHTTAKTELDSTILNKEKFDKFLNLVKSDLEPAVGIKSDLNELRPVGTRNVGVLLGGGKTTNTFTIRVSSAFLVWDPRYLLLAKELASVIAKTLGQSAHGKMTDEKVLKKSGIGYFGNYE